MSASVGGCESARRRERRQRNTTRPAETDNATAASSAAGGGEGMHAPGRCAVAARGALVKLSEHKRGTRSARAKL